MSIPDTLSLKRQTLPIASDNIFVVDTGPNLDKYMFGNDLPNGGVLTFTIPVTRMFSTLISQTLDSNGLPMNSITLTNLISRNVLPVTATLAIAAFEVDDKSFEACKEVDKVYLNGFDVMSGTAQSGQLTGFNNRWYTWYATVPITAVKFVTATGSATTSPAPALQEVKIDVAQGCKDHWAVAIDWAALTIDSQAPLPTVLIHGYTGDHRDLDKMGSSGNG